MTDLRRSAVPFALIALFAASPLLAATPDVEGSRDHPLFNRLPDYYIDTYRETEFGTYDSFVDSDGGYKTVEGRVYYINYHYEEGTEYLTEAAIKANYREALKKIGGVVHYEDSANVHMSLDLGGKVTWVHVNAWNGGQGIALNIVEEAAMEQQIVADADALAQELSLTGRATVYGIYFDTGRAVVKAESRPALVEIHELLNKMPDMKVYVVGHTDTVGETGYNMDLSRRRAQAVVEVLAVEYGVDRARLEPHGVGPLAPASSNRSEDGRAKNRRVELVEK